MKKNVTGYKKWVIRIARLIRWKISENVCPLKIILFDLGSLFFYSVPTYFNSHNTLFLSPIRESKTTVFETTVKETMLCDAVPLRAKSPETSDHVYMDDFFFYVKHACY